MSTSIFSPTNENLTEYNLAQGEENYATMPLMVKKPHISPANEENLHTLFEEAISDRVIAMRKRLSHLSEPGLQTPPPFHVEATSCVTETLQAVPALARISRHRPRWGQKWRRSLRSGCMALFLILLGFDIMGLLVLYAH
jgi:hypothetical protein